MELIESSNKYTNGKIDKTIAKRIKTDVEDKINKTITKP